MASVLPTIHIDPQRCVRCASCVKDCLAKILTLPSEGLPEFISGGAARCFRCQHCLAICPTGALSWSDKTPDNSQPPGIIPKPEHMLNLIRQRRSIRSFRPENVPMAVFNQLLDAMKFVPTGCNDHRLFFSCSETRDSTDIMRKRAAESVLNMIRSGTLPQRIAHFAAMKPALEAGVDTFFRGAPHFVAVSVPPDAKDAHIDPYIAATQFELFANCFGLGTCWGGMATDLLLAVPNLYKHLNLPKGYDLKIVLLFGYPAVKYARTPQPVPCGHTSVVF